MYLHENFKLPQLIQCGFLQIMKKRKLITQQNINKQYDQKRTALHISVISNQLHILQYLIKQFKPDLNIKDSLGLTVKDWIRLKKCQNMYENIIIDQNKNSQQINENGQNQFKLNPLIKNNMDILKASQLSLCLLQQIFECQKKTIYKKDKQQRKALHYASISGNLHTFNYLVSKKFDPLYQDKFGFNCYHYLSCNLQNNPISKYYHIEKIYKNIENNYNNYDNINYSDVLIIGSGAAGIGAGVALARKGVNYIILQARNRIGGRIVSIQLDQYEVDLGACWVHSYSKNNPICKQIKRLHYKCKQSQQYTSSIIKSDMIQNYKHKDIQQCKLHHMKYFSQVQHYAIQSQNDISIQSAGLQYYKKVISHLQPYNKALVDMLINMTQHYQASNISDISAKYYQQREDTGGDFTPQKSYSNLLTLIAKSENVEDRIKFGKQVVEINYIGQSLYLQNKQQNKLCKVTCKDGSIYLSKKIISSIPLGILKSNIIKFIPQLPQSHQQIINKLGWGVMNKIILSFNKPFWKNNPSWIRIACQQKGKYSAIVNFSSFKQNKFILCCFVTDNFAIKISQTLTDEQIVQDLLKLLQKSFNKQIQKPKSYVVTRWNQEKYSLGSYSHFGVGTNMKSSKKLRENINQKLWIVGEHCYGQHIGCAHGAYQTGVWAAEQIVNKMKSYILDNKQIKAKQFN